MKKSHKGRKKMLPLKAETVRQLSTKSPIRGGFEPMPSSPVCSNPCTQIGTCVHCG
jgi:hypothetical protein